MLADNGKGVDFADKNKILEQKDETPDGTNRVPDNETLENKIPERELFKRAMIERHSAKMHEKLQNASVGVAGLGGLGSNVAMALARAGIGSLVICDFDHVELTNLNRQNYYIRHIGHKKTSATLEILKQINPYINYRIHDLYLNSSNYGKVFKDCDIIVEAFDNPECKAELVNWVLLNTDKTVVAASGLAGYGFSNKITTKKIRERFYLVGDLVSSVREGQTLMAPRVGVAANHQADCVISLIMNQEERASC